MNKKFLSGVAALAAGVSMLLTSGGVASAADTTFPNADYGFDGNANLVVGGGSVTVYKIAQGFADLYNDTESCATNNATYNATEGSPATYPQTSPAFNQCSPTTQSYPGVETGGNYDGDTVAIAAPNGSSTGIASLNGSHSGTAATYAYEGTNETIPTTGSDTNSNGLSNGYGTVDFDISSRAAKTSGGNCNLSNPTSGLAGDELQCDTFWGVAADGVQVFTWGSTVGGTADNTTFAGTSGITPTDLNNIWTCADTTWGQLTNYSAAAGLGDPVPPSNAPIVPWSMNSNSGTYADFNTYVDNNGFPSFATDTDAGTYLPTNPGGSTTSPTPVSGKCVRELSSSSNPLPIENDVKPLLTDVQNNQGGLSTSPLSTNNPANWIWFGSNGLLSAYNYLSNPSLFGNQYNTFAQNLNGSAPNPTTIGGDTYPAERILNLVTTKADADCPVVSGVCNLTGGPTNANGVADLNVLGATGGQGGAVREFVRFVCRNKAETTFTANGTSQSDPTDPYTGVSDFTEIGNVISGSGFTLVPTKLRSAGSDCDVQSVG